MSGLKAGALKIWRTGLDNPGALLAGVTASALVLPSVPMWAMVFYLTALPVTAVALAKSRAWMPREAVTVLATALIALFVIALAWDDAAAGHWRTQWLWLWSGISTMVFVRGGYQYFGSQGPDRDRLISWMIGIGTVNAALSLALFPFYVRFDGRLTGWNITKHPILGASIIGVCILLAVGRLLGGGLSKPQRWFAIAMIPLGLAFIYLTGSRGPMIAISASLLLLLALQRWRIAAVVVAAAVVLAGLAAALLPATTADVVAHLTARGWSERLDIWQMALAQIGQRPFFGFGPEATLEGRARSLGSFPHNLLLSTLLYTGAVGASLLAAYFASSLWRAIRTSDPLIRTTGIALVLHTVLSGLTDLSNIIKGPGPMWFIVWLPLILCGSQRRKP